MLKYLLSIATIVLLCSGLFAQPDTLCGKGLPKALKNSKHKCNCYDNAGRRQGLWKNYSYNGMLKDEVFYKDGKMHGASVIYYTKSGKIQEQSEYFDHRKDGKYTSYFVNGQTGADGEYNYGRKSGTWKYYYKNTGRIKMEGSYNSAGLDGDWKYYNTKGELIKTATYKNGKTVSVKKG